MSRFLGSWIAGMIVGLPLGWWLHGPLEAIETFSASGAIGLTIWWSLSRRR